MSFLWIPQGIWIPEGDTVKLPVAIKTVHDRTGRQTFFDITEVRKQDLSKKLQEKQKDSTTNFKGVQNILMIFVIL